jgi:hypothetical protein
MQVAKVSRERSGERRRHALCSDRSVPNPLHVLEQILLAAAVIKFRRPAIRWAAIAVNQEESMRIAAMCCLTVRGAAWR